MSAPFTLYSHKGPGPNPLKPAILLEKLGLEYKVIPLTMSDDADNGVKGSNFMKYNPNGRVPALVDHKNNDFCIWESGAIMFYLVDKYEKQGGKFFGTTPEERALVMQWLTYQLSGLGPTQGNLNYVHHYWEATYGEKASKSDLTRFEGESYRLYQVLDDQLGKQQEKGSQWIISSHQTLADFAFFPWVNIHKMAKLDLTKYKHVTKWLEAMQADEDVKRADSKLPK